MTVWAKTALEADALSTALFVLGPTEGLALAEQMQGVEAVFIEKSRPGRKVSVTSGLSNRTRSLMSRATRNSEMNLSEQEVAKD